MRFLSSICLFLLIVSCDQFQPVQQNWAQVDRVNGLLVFIYAEPQSPYTVIGRLEYDAIEESLKEGQGKSFGKALGDILSKSIENMALPDQIAKMTELAKNQAPQADAIIISHRAFEAEIIQFD